jgi:hypothetical protein
LKNLEKRARQQERATGPTGGSEVWEWTISVIVVKGLAVGRSRSRGDGADETTAAEEVKFFVFPVLAAGFRSSSLCNPTFSPMNSTPAHPPATDTPFLLLFRGPDWDTGRTREETLRIMEQVKSWFEGLQKRGVVRGGAPLARSGKFVSGSGRDVMDGPFAEAKEVIGGYLMIAVPDLAAATAIARECPTLDCGIAIEVRPMLDECPISQRLRTLETLPAAT